MCAQIFKIVSTKVPTKHYETGRRWVNDGQRVDLTDKFSFTPVFRIEGEHYVISLLLKGPNLNRRVDVQRGKWLRHLAVFAGVKILPMAVRFSADLKPDAVLFEFATISDAIELVR